MKGLILRFPRRTAKCANCSRRYSIQDNGERGFCSYHCGAKAQPEHTVTVKQSQGSHA